VIVHTISVGDMLNFTYIIEDEDTGQSILLDPSWDLDKLEEIIRRKSLQIKYIVNTHHHFDHTLGNEAMSKSTKARIIQHTASNLHHDVTVDDNSRIEFGNSGLTVLYTPGHSQDSICLASADKIFTGDTLFVGSCGRVDLPGGSARSLYHSIFDVLYKLDDNLVVFPGHNYGPTPTSTIGLEKRTNPVMQKMTEAEFLQMLGQ